MADASLIATMRRYVRWDVQPRQKASSLTLKRRYKLVRQRRGQCTFQGLWTLCFRYEEMYAVFDFVKRSVPMHALIVHSEAYSSLWGTSLSTPRSKINKRSHSRIYFFLVRTVFFSSSQAALKALRGRYGWEATRRSGSTTSGLISSLTTSFAVFSLERPSFSPHADVNKTSPTATKSRYKSYWVIRR
jgi:hypothetical protein